MIRKLARFFKGDEGHTVLRLDSTVHWLKAQLKDEIKVYTHMLKTVFEDSSDRIQSLVDAADKLEQARLRTEDFPDAPPTAISHKNDIAQRARIVGRELQMLMREKPTDLEGFQELHKKMQAHVDTLETSVAKYRDSVRRYFYSPFTQLITAFDSVKLLLANSHDVLTSPSLRKITDVTAHTHLALEKIDRRGKIRPQLDEINAKTEERYREYLKFDTKIKDIKESERYRLERVIPKANKSTAVGHFSVLEHEIKELEKRKNIIDDGLRSLRAQQAKIQADYNSTNIDDHLLRIRTLLKELTKLDVEVVYE